MTSLIQLERSQQVSDRPFTRLEAIQEDMIVFWGMVERLRAILSQSDSFPDPVCPFFLNSRGGDGCQHRIVILNLPALEASNALIVVVFSGQKQPGSDPTLLDAVDLELTEELCQFPGIVSYSSRKSANGNWINMVLFSHPQAIEHWNRSKKHAVAARELSPKYYSSIRLHKGVLPRGLWGTTLRLQRTKYYHFQEEGVWRAIREAELEFEEPGGFRPQLDLACP